MYDVRKSNEWIGYRPINGVTETSPVRNSPDLAVFFGAFITIGDADHLGSSIPDNF
jgi:hypothetical protein